MKVSDVVLFGGVDAGARGSLTNANRVRTTFNLERFAVLAGSRCYVDAHDSRLVKQPHGVFLNFCRRYEITIENKVETWKGDLEFGSKGSIGFFVGDYIHGLLLKSICTRIGADGVLFRSNLK